MTTELTIGRSALLTDLAMCVNHYRLSTPGLFCCTHVPIQLDQDTRITPGLVVVVNSGPQKQCDPGDYSRFVGAPNFVLDVFAEAGSSEYIERKKILERAGVREYVSVVDTNPLTWDWNRLEDGTFTDSEPKCDTPDAMIKSVALPGLWISPQALRERDWWSVLAGIDRGITRRGHHEFMREIWR